MDALLNSEDDPFVSAAYLPFAVDGSFGDDMRADGMWKIVFILDLLEGPYRGYSTHGGPVTYRQCPWIWTDPEVYLLDPGERLHDYLRAFYHAFMGEPTLYIIDDCSASTALTVSKQPPHAPTTSAVGPCPTVIQIVRRPGTGSLPSIIAPPDHPSGALNIYLFVVMDAHLNFEDGRIVSAANLPLAVDGSFGDDMRADGMWKIVFILDLLEGPYRGYSTHGGPVPNSTAYQDLSAVPLDLDGPRGLPS